MYITTKSFWIFFQDRIKQKCSFPIPIHLIVVIVGTGLSHALCFEKKFEVAVVGKIPKGYLMHSNYDRKYSVIYYDYDLSLPKSICYQS